MSTFVTQPVRTRQAGNSRLLFQALAALVGGLLLFLLGAVVITGAYRLRYAGRIFPGVSVMGVDLSNLTPEEAAVRLSQSLTFPYNGQVLFVDGGRAWPASPADLGMVFDVGATVQAAYAAGRGGGLFENLAGQVNAGQGGVRIDPVVLIDERMAHDFLQQIVPAINQPMLEADLRLDGTTIVYRPGQTGRLLDVEATLALLVARLETFQDGQVSLVIEEQPPLVLDASAEAQTLQTILSQSMVLAVPDMQPGDPGPWTVDAPTLASMLQIVRIPAVEGGGMRYAIEMNTSTLDPLLQQIAGVVDRGTENARFVFNDETLQLELIRPAVIGRELDVQASHAAIQAELLSGSHAISLRMNYTDPQVVSDASAESLGITGLVASQTTYFRTSSQARIQNIQTAAARFHGLLVPPGATFSMAEVLGDVSLEGGYAEALIIYNGQTIKGVGGGVCQVSTTLFRTAFFGGYPIVERHAHAYRVYYYEQIERGYDEDLAGLDATVYVPLVDFKFTNDTPYWLLMETYVNVEARRITWKFYSTSDGRTVDWSTTGPENVDPPPAPLFVSNNDLAPNEITQVDWPADGADVTVTRTVTRDGAILHQDSLHTRYTAWQAVCEYGPGTEDPEALAAERGKCQP